MTCKGGNDEECSNSGSAQSSAPAFSYYSISSASSTRAEGLHMAQYVTCVKSTLKWRSLVLQRRDNKDRVRRRYTRLADEDVEILVANTDFSEAEVREWWREFLMVCPEGVLTRDKYIGEHCQVAAMLAAVLPEHHCNIVAELIFSTFDRDRDGFIDFSEFLLATHGTAVASPEDKLRWAFQLYDKDGSKAIHLSEMLEVFGTLYLNEGVSEQLAIDRAQRIFSCLDTNNDGEITEEEFVTGCLQDEGLVTSLSERSTAPPLAEVEVDPGH